MGTAQIQGELWGAKATDWAEVQEPGWRQVYEQVLRRAGVGRGTRLLDIGCGAGGALDVARALGAEVCGIDASPNLVEIARARVPDTRIDVGEMEGLAFESDAFDVVTGFNSFQFAGDVVQALREARRVCRPAGSVVVLFWGRREECDLLSGVLPAVSALVPSLPPGPARPALADPGVAEALAREASLVCRSNAVVDCQLVYPDKITAFRAVASAAPFVRAERLAGSQALEAAVLPMLDRFTKADGSVVLNNRMRYLIAARG